jgi:hypothetical protein
MKTAKMIRKLASGLARAKPRLEKSKARGGFAWSQPSRGKAKARRFKG